MNEYKANSRLSKKMENVSEPKEKKKVEKIVNGVVKSKKRNWFLRLFLSDDAVDIKSFIIEDVLIPSARKAIDDIISNGKDILLYGETGRSRKSTSSRISYRSYYEREDRERDKDRSNRRSGSYSYDDVILESRTEAEEVIARLDELIDVYGMASVADLYDLVGISGQYTDNKYGWTDVRSATHVRVRDGYLLKMPRAKPL